MDTIVIPVRDMGGWTWYYTSRVSHSQGVVRFPSRERVLSFEVLLAQGHVDGLMFLIGRGYMTKFLQNLIHDTQGEGSRKVFLRNLVKGQLANPNYGYDAEQTYRMEEMSPGELTMFMLHTLLASGEDRLDGIWKAQATLLVDTDGGTPGYMYCRWAMQLTFAAGRCIGKLTSTKEQKEQKEQQEGSVPSSAARGRGRGSTSPHQAV